MLTETGRRPPEGVSETEPKYDMSSDQQEREMTENLRGEILPKGNYTRCGTFIESVMPRLVASKEYSIPNKIKATWTGNISLASRPEVSRTKVETVTTARNLDHYYVRASETTRTRCIDGRCIACYGESEDTSVDRPLGPQVPGGTATAALCDRIAAWGRVYTENFNLIEDIHGMKDRFDALGFAIGGHIDDHAPENMTGCGAIDKVPEILERVTTPLAQKQVRQIARMLLGENYDQDVTDAIMGRLLSLQGLSNEYFKQDEQGNYLYRKEAIETLKKRNPEGVAKLVGKHREIGLVVNLVKDTTFHTDQFSVDNDNEIQLFNYDFWRTIKLAENLYPLEGDDDTIATNKLLRQRFITTRVLFAVGTCMVLTDGSLELIVRS